MTKGRKAAGSRPGLERLLVSLCNLSPRGLGLGLIGLPTDANHIDQGTTLAMPAFRWIDLSAITGSQITGATGLCMRGDEYWCLAQVARTGASVLVRLDSRLAPLGAYPLPLTRDGHSLVQFEDGFLVADTGHNRVNYVEVLAENGAAKETEFWRGRGEDEDVVHLNSVARLGTDVFVSVFGAKSPSGWQATQRGSVINVSKGEAVCTDVHHPHSLIPFGESLFWLESGRGRIHSFSVSAGHQVEAEIPGYLRGLSVDEDSFYVTASAARQKSRSTGSANTAATEDWRATHSWLYRMGRRSGIESKWVLSPFGAEPFDLLRIASPAIESAADATDAVLDRMYRYEAQLQEQTELGLGLARELASLKRQQREAPAPLPEFTGMASLFGGR